jgi:hypothetical protein
MDPRHVPSRENRHFIRTRKINTPWTWIDMVGYLNFTWKALALYRDSRLRTSAYTTDPVCVGLTTAQFIECTSGAFVEERDTSIVSHFWTGPTDDCPDRQWVRRQAAEAQNHISDSHGGQMPRGIRAEGVYVAGVA